MTWAKMALNYHPLREVKDCSIMLGLGHPKPFHITTVVGFLPFLCSGSRDGKRKASLQLVSMLLVPTEPMQRLPKFEARPSRSKQPTRLA